MKAFCSFGEPTRHFAARTAVALLCAACHVGAPQSAPSVWAEGGWILEDGDAAADDDSLHVDANVTGELDAGGATIADARAGRSDARAAILEDTGATETSRRGGMRVQLPPLSVQRTCPERPSSSRFSVLGPSEVMVAAGGLFRIDLTAGVAVRSNAEHAPCQISAFGQTLAVGDMASSGEVGLSLDGGKSYAWTHPANLSRCQGSALVATEAALLVSCVSGLSRWTGGTEPPASIAYSVPTLVGDGRRVVVATPDAMYLSDDSGVTFAKRALPAGVAVTQLVAVVGEAIYLTGRASDFTPTLYVAQWSGPFNPIAESVPLSAATRFESKDGVLTLFDEARVFIRRSMSTPFAEVTLSLAGTPDAAAKVVDAHYAYGSLYVMLTTPNGVAGEAPVSALLVIPLLGA